MFVGKNHECGKQMTVYIDEISFAVDIKQSKLPITTRRMVLDNTCL